MQISPKIKEIGVPQLHTTHDVNTQSKTSTPTVDTSI